MLSQIGRIVVFAVMVLQQPEPSLEQQYLTAMGVGSRLAMVTLIATHEDGTPVKGFIQCAGSWYKHGDTEAEQTTQSQLPFATDARGAIIMNPAIADEWVFCWCEDKGKRGSVTVQFSADDPLHVVRIVLNNQGLEP